MPTRRQWGALVGTKNKPRKMSKSLGSSAFQVGDVWEGVGNPSTVQVGDGLLRSLGGFLHTEGTLFSASLQVVAMAGKFRSIDLMEPDLHSQAGGAEKTPVIHPESARPD